MRSLMVLPLLLACSGTRRESADCAERGADAGDDRPSDRDGDERVEEAGGKKRHRIQARATSSKTIVASAAASAAR